MRSPPQGVLPDPAAQSFRARALAMLALILSAELIYSLPYHLTRYYRPTVLEAFGLSNATLGDLFALYGLAAMISYPPGGVLADHFSTRKLIMLSLFTTALGGVYFATLPGVAGLAVLYTVWGVSTVLLFWSAMIRATRMWGGRSAQGRGFGLLECGRGLVAALGASIGVAILDAGLGSEPALASEAQRAAALRNVILFYAGLTAAAGVVVWRWLPDPPVQRWRAQRRPWELGSVLRNRAVWLQATIVVCAYCGFKGFDFYSLYARDAFGMDEAEAAGFAALAAYTRPVGTILAGLVGDRLGIARTVKILFLSLVVCWVALSAMDASGWLALVIYADLLAAAFCVFALRSLYFAMLEQTGIPFARTGAAVGLISLVGYTPDIFFHPLAGRLVDSSPGVSGHQNAFMLLSGIAVLGCVATVLLRGLNRSGSSAQARE